MPDYDPDIFVLLLLAGNFLLALLLTIAMLDKYDRNDRRDPRRPRPRPRGLHGHQPDKGPSPRNPPRSK